MLEANCDKWFYLCLVMLGVIALLLLMVFNYSLKVKDKTIHLEKCELDHQRRIKNLEKKNGHELAEIEDVKAQVSTLKEIIDIFIIQQKKPIITNNPINQQPKSEKMETTPQEKEIKTAPTPPPPPPMPESNPSKNWENDNFNKDKPKDQPEKDKEPIKVKKEKSHHELLKEALNKRRKKIENKK